MGEFWIFFACGVISLRIFVFWFIKTASFTCAPSHGRIFYLRYCLVKYLQKCSGLVWKSWSKILDYLRFFETCLNKTSGFFQVSLRVHQTWYNFLSLLAIFTTFVRLAKRIFVVIVPCLNFFQTGFKLLSAYPGGFRTLWDALSISKLI